MATIENIESEIKEIETQIKLQKLKNELDLHRTGSLEHLIYGIVRIIDNPALLLLVLVAFAAGIVLGGNN